MIKVNLLDSVSERQSSAAVVEEKVANPAARFWMMGAAVAGLLCLGIVFDYYSASASQARAKQELERQQQIAAQMAAVNKEQAELEKKLKDIQSRIEVIKKLRTSQQGPVALLSDINARIPADPNFSLEFSDGLFLNVSIEAERKEVQVNAADYVAEGPVDLSVRPEVFTSRSSASTARARSSRASSRSRRRARAAKGGRRPLAGKEKNDAQTRCHPRETLVHAPRRLRRGRAPRLRRVLVLRHVGDARRDRRGRGAGRAAPARQRWGGRRLAAPQRVQGQLRARPRRLRRPQGAAARAARADDGLAECPRPRARPPDPAQVHAEGRGAAGLLLGQARDGRSHRQLQQRRPVLRADGLVPAHRLDHRLQGVEAGGQGRRRRGAERHR